jgi:hypothetical protein
VEYSSFWEEVKTRNDWTVQEAEELFDKYQKLNDPNYHKDGVAWYDAPIPPVEHECWVQSRGMVGSFVVDRCACGSIRYNGSPWENRNSRTS